MECKCGVRLRNPVYPVYCRCGAVHGAKLPKQTVCKFRGEYKGKPSCRCHPVYQCDLLGKLCGNGKPLDEFVDLGGVLLNDKNYQNCNDCKSNTVGQRTEAVCVVCGSAATTMCGHTLSAGMCGAALCGNCKHEHSL